MIFYKFKKIIFQIIVFQILFFGFENNVFSCDELKNIENLAKEDLVRTRCKYNREFIMSLSSSCLAGINMVDPVIIEKFKLKPIGKVYNINTPEGIKNDLLSQVISLCDSVNYKWSKVALLDNPNIIFTISRNRIPGCGSISKVYKREGDNFFNVYCDPANKWLGVDVDAVSVSDRVVNFPYKK